MRIIILIQFSHHDQYTVNTVLEACYRTVLQNSKNKSLNTIIPHLPTSYGKIGKNTIFFILVTSISFKALNIYRDGL